MPRNTTTGVFTRTANSFSNPVLGTLIDPADATDLFDDYDTGLSLDALTGPLIMSDTTDITIPTPYVMSGAFRCPGGGTFGKKLQVFGGFVFIGDGTNSANNGITAGQTGFNINGGTSGAAAGGVVDFDSGNAQAMTLGTFGAVTNGLVSGVFDLTPTWKSNKASGDLFRFVKHLTNSSVAYALTIGTDLSATIGGFIATPASVTMTGTSGTVAATTSALIINASGGFTLTLPAAASYPGRWLTVKSIAAQTIISASSNVVPLAGGAAGTALLSNTAGKWATLQSDGTSWIIMASN